MRAERSLHDGGNNFGVVTSFELQTKPLKDDLLFGGIRTFTEGVFDDVVKAWIDLTLTSAKDPKAGSWIVWMSPGVKVASTELWYGANLANGSDSVGITPFYNITAVSDTTKTRGHAAYVVENEATNTYGLCEIFCDLSVKAHDETASQSVGIFFEQGGNAMECDVAQDPIHIIQLACSWNNAFDDDKAYQVISDIMKQIKKESIALGVDNDWVYMIYASQFQDGIASYGEESKVR
ncbi:hypothetical protein E8E12_002386 [Didymella heteroderae]|uniref:Uncharacterized protein n=1 Tax=Didymella heteroderae TaxID=1769908 RepID=A0A9P4WNG3_9PLEO|nr:hypothetical protein E8E12_002386 [Didymella heteroderae]